MAQCPICGAPVAGAENHACENCRQASYTAYTDAQGRPVFASDAPQQPERRLPATPITKILLAVNIAVFLLMAVNGIANKGFGDDDPFFRWGANFGPAVLNGQYWRLVTAVFLHGGLWHVAVNMWSLWQLGNLAERLLGRNAYLGLYLLSGIAGNILSIAVNPLVLSVGASGAVFGLAGALIAILIFVRLDAPPDQIARLRNNLISVVIINLILGGMIAHIDNFAHVGGLVCGFSIAFLLSSGMRESAESYRHAKGWVFPLAMTILGVALFMVCRWRLPWLAQHPLLSQ
jgi:rhomboid protease GluP